MGPKGSELSSAAVVRAEEAMERLAGVAKLSKKTMFGGVGIFASGKMFAIVDSAGSMFLREGTGNRPLFDAAGAARHARMPYRSIPDSVWAHRNTLAAWARSAIEVAQQAG